MSIYYDNTEGKNWESDLHRISSGINYPLLNRLTFSFTGDYAWQNYKNIHTLSGKGISGFSSDKEKRKDRIYNISGGVTYELSKSVNMNFRYMHTVNDSIFPIYYYKRDVYSIDILYRF